MRYFALLRRKYRIVRIGNLEQKDYYLLLVYKTVVRTSIIIINVITKLAYGNINKNHNKFSPFLLFYHIIHSLLLLSASFNCNILLVY